MAGKSEFSSDPSESILEAPASPFLRLPREIRDEIYRMLLTTPYTYVERYRFSRFHGCPCIWLANKQIAAEATKILYEENKVGLHEHRKDRSLERKPKTLITSIQGIPLIIQSLWSFLSYAEMGRSEWYIDLTLQIPNEVSPRLIHHVLHPWTQLSGFNNVTLEGHIDENTVASYTKCLQSRPTPSDVTRWMEIHQSEMESAFRRKDDQAAQSLWLHMSRHWQYYDILDGCRDEKFRPIQCSLQNSLDTAMLPILNAGMDIVKSHIREGLYYLAQRRIDWMRKMISANRPRNNRMPSIFDAKLHLCMWLTVVAQKTVDTNDYLDLAVDALLRSNRYKDHKYEDLLDELRYSIENYTSTLEPPEFNAAGYPDRPIGGDSTLVERRSFWEWLDLPEE